MRTWTKKEIQEMIEKNDLAVQRGLVALLAKQTEAEQDAEQTSESNGIGFNGVDAPFLTSLAKQFSSKGFLSEKQVAMARKAIRKYSGQLTRIANGEL